MKLLSQALQLEKIESVAAGTEVYDWKEVWGCCSKIILKSGVMLPLGLFKKI